MLQAPFNQQYPGIFGNSFLPGDQINRDDIPSPNDNPYQLRPLPRMDNQMMHPHVMPRNPQIDMSQILGQPQNPNQMRPQVQQPQMPVGSYGMGLQSNIQRSNPMNRMQPQQMNQQVHSNQNFNQGKNSKALGSYGGF